MSYILIDCHDVIETRVNENDTTICVSKLDRIKSYGDVGKLSRGVWWGEFVTNLLSQNFTKNLTSDEKIALTKFIRDNIFKP
jgi:hypothetical protein